MAARGGKVVKSLFTNLTISHEDHRKNEASREHAVYGAILSGFIADANTSATPSLDLEACGLGSVRTSPSRLGITFFSFLYSSLKCIIPTLRQMKKSTILYLYVRLTMVFIES